MAWNDIQVGSWTRIKSRDELERLLQQWTGHIRRPLSEEQLRYGGERAQVGNCVEAWMSGPPVYVLLGAPGAWFPEFFDIETGEPEPLNYEYSGRLAQKHFPINR